MMGKSYMLSLPEFYLLVGKAGNSCVFGFSETNSDSCSETALVYRINKMVRTGLIKADENGLTPKSDLWDIICDVSKAQKCVVFNFSDCLKGVLCCYIGKNVIVTSLDSNRKNKAIRLKRMKKEDFFIFCKELLKYDDMCTYDADGFEESAAIDFLRNNGFKMKVVDLTALDEIVWVIDEYCSKDGRLKRRTCLADNIPYAQMLKISEESLIVVNLNEEETERLLESFYD